MEDFFKFCGLLRISELYVKILTIPYKGGWVVCKRPKTPLRNIKMAPNRTINFNQILNFEFLTVLFQADPWVCAHRGHSTTSCGFTFSEFFEIGREALVAGTGGCVFA